MPRPDREPGPATLGQGPFPVGRARMRRELSEEETIGKSWSDVGGTERPMSNLDHELAVESFDDFQQSIQREVMRLGPL